MFVEVLGPLDLKVGVARLGCFFSQNESRGQGLFSCRIMWSVAVLSVRNWGGNFPFFLALLSKLYAHSAGCAGMQWRKQRKTNKFEKRLTGSFYWSTGPSLCVLVPLAWWDFARDVDITPFLIYFFLLFFFPSSHLCWQCTNQKKEGQKSWN